MASKVANISDLIQRVASSCLTNPVVKAARPHHGGIQTIGDAMVQEEDEEDESTGGEEEEERLIKIWEEESEENGADKCGGGAIGTEVVLERVKEMEGFMSEVFDTVSAVKRAYVSLQEAHCPWDPDKMRAADASVVAELRRLGRLRDRFRRGAPAAAAAAAPLREVVAPYEAALEDLKKELKAKEAEVEELKERLRNTTPRCGGGSGAGRKIGRRLHSSSSCNRVGCTSGLGQCFFPVIWLNSCYMTISAIRHINWI